MASSAGDQMRRAAKALYNVDAEAYEAGWAPVLRPYAVRLVQSMPLADAVCVADAGAGVGGLLPDLQCAAPRATVIALDGSEGMLARAPSEFPRAVTDLQQLTLVDGCLDAAVAVFVLFHLPDPLRGARELGRALKPGGVLGTITWDGESAFPAQLAWLEELNACAAPGATVLDHDLLSSPEKMERLLGEAGFKSVRAWTAPFEHRYRREDFLDMRTRRGTSRSRFDTLSAEQQRVLLRRVRRRFDAMGSEDFVDRAGMIYATAVRG